MIEVKQLTKDFGGRAAVTDLNFKLVPGEILGFLGPNGAGKSTTMKMLTGYLRPTSGRASIWGCDVWLDTLSAQKHIGYLPEGAPLYEEMTPVSFLSFIAEARGLKGAERQIAVDQSIVKMALGSVLEQKIETLSKGFKRRVGLAQAILHDPDVLILDEPTDGLDPNQKYEVREMIKGLSKDKIVIISTHILEEVTAVCNRVMVLAGGRIVSDSSPADFIAKSAYHGAVTLSIKELSLTDDIIEAFGQLQQVKDVQATGDLLTVFPMPGIGDVFPHLAELAQERGWVYSSVHIETGRLDEVFRELTESAVQANSLGQLAGGAR